MIARDEGGLAARSSILCLARTIILYLVSAAKEYTWVVGQSEISMPGSGARASDPICFDSCAARALADRNVCFFGASLRQGGSYGKHKAQIRNNAGSDSGSIDTPVRLDNPRGGRRSPHIWP